MGVGRKIIEKRNKENTYKTKREERCTKKEGSVDDENVTWAQEKVQESWTGTHEKKVRSKDSTRQV